MESVDAFWQWLTEQATPPPLVPFLLVVAAGIAITFHPVVWSRSRYLATWIHEAGHALAAIASGRTVTGMRVEGDSSGVTHHVGAATGFGRIITAAAGYPAPAVVGALMLWLAGTGRAHWATGLLSLCVLVLLPLQRSLRGIGVSVALVGTLVVVATKLPSVEVWLLAALAGYLIAASPRTIVELHRVRSNAEPGEEHSDADTLAGITGAPAVLWEAVFLVFSVGTAGVAVWLLVSG